MRKLRISTLLLAALIATGCNKKKEEDPGAAAAASQQTEPELKHGLTPEQAAQPLAKVGDTVITLGEFAERLASQSPYLQARYNSPERRQEFLENMVRFELLAIEAKKRGLDKEEEVKRVERQMMVQQMMKEMFDDQGVKLSDISDADIKAYYDQHKDEFNKPAQRRASWIVMKNKAAAQKVLDQLKSKPDTMQAFRDTAKDKNEDELTKSRFGDLRFFAQTPEEGDGGPPQAVRTAVFALDGNGALHPELIETEQGFAIVKLTGKRAALSRSLEDARRLIQNRLWRKRREDAIEGFVGGLREKANVKEDLALLSEVKVDMSATGAADEQARAAEAADQDGDQPADQDAEDEAAQ